MKFGPVPVFEAKGAILAHALQLPDQRLKKGRVLSVDDLAAIHATGEEQIIVARLEPGDVAEDEAAKRIKRVLWNDPATGVMRHADAGYEIAEEVATKHELKR